MSRPDPYKATRAEFSKYIVEKPCPENASEEFRKRWSSTQHLFSLLMNHDAMKPNMEQTCMAPAESKNKVYFMWDFVGRTLGMMLSLDPTIPPSQLSQSSRWNDVIGRISMAELLILDRKGTIRNLNAAAGYHDEVEEEGIAFGAEIEAAVSRAAHPS